MPRLEFDGYTCDRLPEESVLDALLRAGHHVPHSCKSGVCGSCLMKAGSADAVPAAAQAGLKETWQASGYFLACLCRPVDDFAARPADGDVRVSATITGLDRLSTSVLRVWLTTDTPLDYRPGQYVTVLRSDGLARSYSVASLPSAGRLELHVRVLPDGRMSQWLALEAAIGDRLSVLGPSGDCFYVRGRAEQPLLLAGTGTGLAPLYGIACDALDSGHRGPIHLLHGAATREGLYLTSELGALARAHANFRYSPSVFDEDGPLETAVLSHQPMMNGWRAYVCGDPALVKRLRKTLFLAGAALNDIHADAFLPSAPGA